jgi:hypothetical protein
MAKYRDRQSEYKQHQSERHSKIDELDEVVADEADETAEVAFEQPFCPRCGWHNTRPSYSSNLIDMLVRVFGLRPYRCRSCGNRFRCIPRVGRA